jgi:pilus assembly protein Flp/PilA
MNMVDYARMLIFRISGEERGASLVEYALLVALIAVAAVVAITAFGGALSSEYSEIAETIP